MPLQGTSWLASRFRGFGFRGSSLSDRASVCECRVYRMHSRHLRLSIKIAQKPYIIGSLRL